MSSLSGFISPPFFTHVEAEASMESWGVQLVLANVMLVEGQPPTRLAPAG